MNESYDWLFEDGESIERPVKGSSSRKSSDIYWTMKNGDEIQIGNMATSHIHHCLRLIRNVLSPENEKRKYWEQAFTEELSVRSSNPLDTDYSL